MIAIVDLRLVGVGSRQLAVTKLSKDTLPWVWGAFGLAAITGGLLFVSKASSYMAQPLLPVEDGHADARRHEHDVLPLLHLPHCRALGPRSLGADRAKVAGGLSLVFWLLVLFFGRMIGFTLGIFGS
jgi:hypothetical protein